jgi:acid phosphatase type 7
MRKMKRMSFLLFAFASTLSWAQTTITRGPYLNNSDTKATIRWRTNIATNSVVTLGAQTFSDNFSTTEHIVKLTGLTPDTHYSYQIGSSDFTFPADSNYHFHTAPISGAFVRPVTVIGFGDFGVNTTPQNDVENVLPHKADIWQWYGDNAYPVGSAGDYETNTFGTHYLKHYPKLNLLPSLGNHDAVSASPTTQTGPYFDYFSLPSAGEYGGVASNTEAYYSYNYGHVHFIVLESTVASFRSPTGAMANWLRQDMQADNSRWRVVYFHHPPFSKGSHNSDTEIEMVEMRENVLPILEQYGADLVLSGHSHGYERSHLMHGFYGTSAQFNESYRLFPGTGFPNAYRKTNKGTVYAVVGTGGIGLGGTGIHKAMATSIFNKYGFAKMTFTRDSLWFQFIDASQQIADQFIIHKTSQACPDALTLTSPPHSSTQLYKAHSIISSANQVMNNSTIWYSAGKSIELTPGFMVPQGSVFRAFIAGCDSP